MKITISKTELTNQMAKILPFIERKTTIPILANVLMQAEADHLTISATDLDVSLRATIPSVKVKTEGTCIIPGHKLADTIKKLKTLADTDVTLESQDHVSSGKTLITITCGALTVKIPGMAASNYPSLPKIPTQVIELQTEVLSTLIARTRFAISGEESRYTLNGALLLLRPDSITMVATDGYRLAHIKHGVSIGVTNEVKTLIPRDTIDRLRTLLDATKSKTVTFAIDHGAMIMFFAFDNWLISSRELTGQFPNYEMVMPKDNRKRLTIGAAVLTDVVTRISAFANERSHALRCELLRDGLKLSAESSETGEASETVPAQYNGAPLVIGLNAEYLLDYLKTYKNGAHVEIQFKDEQSSAMFVPVDLAGYEFRTVIMPMRL